MRPRAHQYATANDADRKFSLALEELKFAAVARYLCRIEELPGKIQGHDQKSGLLFG
jgi:hypothetical protein